jgi:hypothetical protein
MGRLNLLPPRCPETAHAMFERIRSGALSVNSSSSVRLLLLSSKPVTGDEELRQQILLLLAHEANTTGFVEVPAPEVAVKRPIGNEDLRRSPSADRFLPGAILAGRYRVVA